WRSFEAYPLLVALAGADSVQVPITDDAARHDFAALASAITDRTRVILLCSPNNPTGPAIRQGELADFLGAVPSDVLVVLDEAYVQFITDPEAARFEALDKDFPNLVSLRTFSKAYGLAGLRVGYAIARPRIAEAVRAASTPFGVNAAAQLAARVSLGMGEAMRERVAVIVGQRERMAEALRGQGWNLPDAQGNFVWLPLGAQSAPFAQAAAAAGILVRPFDGEGVRVTAGEPEAIDALLEITPSWL
ncbi:MAG: aminotransferase class I/II-fold pyridoxal phosphate-dependent enzyme, partial [Bifidobacteriaceae bacterium]|nr:aminotransferase class I/II-fold pyridoxal phosphate-dependent enzyme [Bifidobacteriaceae bacterium]